jgi:DNA-binding transcriptional LysR family regulator
MILNINQLRAFYTVAKSGSVTKAAQQLMVTPPAITMQVKQLEKAVGIRLAYREGNSVSLTDVGKTVFERAEKIFGEIHDMEDFLEDISTGKSGELQIGCSQTAAKYLMPQLVAAFKDAYPGIRIVLDQGTNAVMLQSILDQKNELVLIGNRSDDKRLKMKIIGKIEVVLTTAAESIYFPSEEISVSDVSTAPMIIPKQGSALREAVLEYLRKFRVTPSVAIESANMDLIKELVSQDKGVSFLESYGLEEPKDRALRKIRILEGSPTVELGIAYLNRRNLSPAAWAFLRLLDKSHDLLPFVG